VLHLLLVAVVAGAAYVRMSDLAAMDFTLEELNHYHAGKSLARSEGPRLPSGEWYGRGVEYSWMGAWTAKWIDTPEIALRMPSALFGTATVAWEIIRVKGISYCLQCTKIARTNCGLEHTAALGW
jgi:hypothetical protein